MGFQHSDAQPIDPVFMCSLGGINALGHQFRGDRTTAPVSGTYETANKVFFYPFQVNQPFLISRFWWLNGATVGTNNVQVGVYDQSFALVSSCASTLSAGANGVQYANPSGNAWLPAMRGYIAMWCNGTTATFFRVASWTRVGGIYLQTGQTGGLPATATPATPSGIPTVYVCGFTRRASP